MSGLKLNLFDNDTEEQCMQQMLNDAAVLNSCKDGIHYSTKIAIPKNQTPCTISYKEVDKYDFSNGFIEFLMKPDFVHLYFDFDSIHSKAEYDDVVKWLDGLCEVFGDYSIGGYTNNEEMQSVGFKLIPDAHKYLSIHVVYYNSMIKSDELVSIMRYTDNKGYKDYHVHPQVDPNVYKLGTRQAMRHVLSDKIINDANTTVTAGYILGIDKPSSQIITIRGDEDIITKEEWLKVFPTVVRVKEAEKMQREERKQLKRKANEFEFEDNLVLFDHDEMQELLSHFAPEFDIMSKTLAPIYHSPMDKQFIIDEMLEWYSQRDHSNGTNCVNNFIDSYYKYEATNKWFYSVIKHLSEDVRQQYINKYKKSSINTELNINEYKLSFQDVVSKRYKLTDGVELINDLKCVIGFVKSRWFIKEFNGGYHINEYSDDKMFKMLKNYKPFIGCTSITLAQIVSKYSTYFQYRDAKFTQDNQDGIINLFQGFKYEESTSDDFTPLEPFLNHMRHIVCNDDEAKYNYIMCWFASIFQKITVKLGTMLIIHGSQGSGKSFPIELFCELLGRNALANVDDLDKVFGKFNGLIGANLLININEPPEASDKFAYAGKIKSKLTQKKTIKETKGVDQIEIESWANYTMTTNNPNPIMEEKGDRRIIYFATNNEKCGDEQYFNQLCHPYQQEQQGEYNAEMMGLLLHYMRTQIDISDYHPERLIRQINANTQTNYNEQLERQYLDLNAVDRYVVDHYKQFEIGMALDLIKIDGYKSTGIAKKLGSICDVTRMVNSKYSKMIEGHEDLFGYMNITQYQVRVYKLKAKQQIPDLYAIIEYKAYNDSNDEQDANDNVDIDE